MSVRDDTTPVSDEYGSSVPIAVYLAGAAVITLIAVYFTRETKGIDLAGAAVITLIAVYFTRETKGIDLATVDQAHRDDLAKAGVS